MKKLILFESLFLSLFFLTITFCCKNEDPIINADVKGKWTGLTFSTDGIGQTLGFIVNDDHSLKGFGPGEQEQGSGTWTINGNHFEVKFKYYSSDPEHEYLFSGKVDVKNNKMSGTYGLYPRKDGKGTWEMKKQ